VSNLTRTRRTNRRNDPALNAAAEYVFARLASRARSESAPVLVGISVLALHLLDDSYLQPEAGTAAGEHLVSGLVPLGLLLLTAAAYPWMRAGVRTAVAVCLGLFGVVAGAVEAGYHSVSGGLSGDDYTGLFALLAGLMLVTHGTVQLWKTRRLDESRPRR
jgi:uncharacterized protein